MITIYCDGGRKVASDRSAAAAVAFGIGGAEIAYLARYIPGKTNNEMEYEGLRLGVVLANALGERQARFFCDSKLIVEQVLGNWRIKEQRLRPLREEVVRMATASLDEAEILWVPRGDNKRADELYNLCIKRRRDLQSGVDVLPSPC